MAINSGLTIVCEWAEVAGTSLRTLIGANVARWLLPTSFENTAAAIVIHNEAMSAHARANVQTDTYVIKCYGGTANPKSAEAVFAAVHDRFHNAMGNTGTGGIVSSYLVAATPSIDPDTGWPVYIARYEIQTS